MHASDTQVMTYCPLGSGALGLMETPTIVKIASKHGRSQGQVILAWHMQRGLVPIPKSTNQGRLESNLEALDFELDGDDMEAISALDAGLHVCPDPKDIA
jgi:2,5-diketo-D-gluconate reductase A